VNPNNLGSNCGAGFSTFFNATTGAITNPGQFPAGVIGETFNVRSDCTGSGPGCTLGAPTATVGPPPLLLYYPAQLPVATGGNACPSACGGGGTAFEGDIECCNPMPLTCGVTAGPVPNTLAVDTTVFNPGLRTRQGGPFQIGYVGRLTAEKNVRALARLEEALLALGHRDFRIVVVGQGAEEKWLRDHMKQVEFTGLLTGRELSQTFANLDLLAFPSETDTFGLVVLEAFASGVPAVVTGGGGPKYTVRHGRTGYAAYTFDEFVSFTSLLMSRPDLHSAMRVAAREQAVTTSWDRIFEGVYEAYETGLFPAAVSGHTVFDTATT